MEMPRSRGVGVDQIESRQPPGRMQDQIAGNAFGGGER
jgi:hypothetical protein